MRHKYYLLRKGNRTEVVTNQKSAVKIAQCNVYKIGDLKPFQVRTINGWTVVKFDTEFDLTTYLDGEKYKFDETMLISQFDGDTIYEVIEITGDKTFIIHGRYKSMQRENELAPKVVKKKMTLSSGIKALII